jgi:hypothetical protein
LTRIVLDTKKIKLISLFNDIAPVDEKIKKPYKVQTSK